MLLTQKKGKIANIVLQALWFIKLVLFIFSVSSQIKTNYFEADVTFFGPWSCRANTSSCDDPLPCIQCRFPKWGTWVTMMLQLLWYLSHSGHKGWDRHFLDWRNSEEFSWKCTVSSVFWAKSCLISNVSKSRCSLLLHLVLLMAKENLKKKSKSGIIFQCRN